MAAAPPTKAVWCPIIRSQGDKIKRVPTLLSVTSPNANRFHNSFTDRLASKFAIKSH